MQHNKTKSENVRMIFGDVSKSGEKVSKPTLTFRDEKIGMTMSILLCECFHNSVDLLSLSWKPDIHQESAQCDIKRIVPKVKPSEICAQSSSMKFVTTETTLNFLKQYNWKISTYVAANTLATSALETASVSLCK